MEDEIISLYNKIMNEFAWDDTGVELFTDTSKLDDGRKYFVAVRVEVV